MDPLEYPKTSYTKTCIEEVVIINVQTLSIDRLQARQKKDNNCRNLAAQSCQKKQE